MATRVTSRLFSTTRAALSSAPRKFDFLVICPDKADALPRRLKARPAHYENMMPNVKDGSWKIGGALLKDVPKDDEPSSLDFLGSSIIVTAESKEAVLKMLHEDPYAKADVWDFEKVQIYPFKAAWKTTSHI